MRLILALLGGVWVPLPAARLSWEVETAREDGVVSARGSLLEARNFGNAAATSPVINGVAFEALDVTAGDRPERLQGLAYRTGENGKRLGAGLNELFDTIAYQSGRGSQEVSLVGLTVGQEYEVQFFYYHDTVDRSVTIRDDDGGAVTIAETGQPRCATGRFRADGVSQSLVFEANTGSQFFNAYQLRQLAAGPPVDLGRVLISEFMASNGRTFIDAAGNSPDWIEIWNATPTDLDLQGWALSIRAEPQPDWIFPSISLRAGERLLVLASGSSETNGGSELHAGLTLKKDGGSLALLKPEPNGSFEVVSEFRNYPAQRREVSFGYPPGEEVEAPLFLVNPTPGAVNRGPGVTGFVEKPAVRPERGFYEAPFEVVIQPGEGAEVRYTLDGSEPGPEHGLAYQRGSGLAISSTTILRAAAFRDGEQPSEVVTQTYLFPAAVVTQPDEPPGFPQTWTGSDYGMEADPEDLALVAGQAGLSVAEAQEVIRTALLELPALSLVMPTADWFDPEQGIYANSLARGRAWERACSAELLFPPGLAGDPFQINCGVRVQGNTSRNPVANPKRSLRLVFRSEYGAPQLRYPFFGPDSAAEFDTIVLRSNSQDAWVYDTERNRRAQFVRDAWARETHRRMGHASPDSNWVHLFLNGLYWGVYNPTERPDASHGESYYGAEKENWDAIKNHQEVLDGNDLAYRDLLSLIQVDPDNWNAGYRDLSGTEAYEEVVALLDLDMLIDYFIHNMYAAADDWPGNYYSGYDRSGESGGWRFFDWDNEHGMKNHVSLNRTRPHVRDRVSPTKFHHALKANPEYRLRFADRLHCAFFKGGVLAVDPDHPGWDPLRPERNVPASLWMELTGAIESALVAESARWGDYRRSRPYTVAHDFVAVRDELLRHWFPQRSDTVLAQFRREGLYPELDAPQANHDGGQVEPGFSLKISGPPGADVFFTTDGADPRLPPVENDEVIVLPEDAPVRAQVPDEATFASAWREPGFDDSGWLSGSGGVGYELIPSDYLEWIGLPVPQMRGRNRSVLIRHPFELSPEERFGLTSLILKMRYEDGFVAYLNGEEVASAQAPARLAWDSGATAGRSDALAVQAKRFDLSAHLGLLREGRNVLAIHGLNDGLTSSDFLMQAQLVTGGAAGMARSARRMTGPIVIEESTRIRARSFAGGEWSALNEIDLFVGAPAGREHLVVSELMYHAAAGSSEDFVELLNRSATETIDLGGVAFTDGIYFEFPFGTTLQPGERIVVAADPVAFRERYDSGIRMLGPYQARLANGGERLVLRGREGEVIREFSYDDEGGWPVEADGTGRSLVLINASTASDHGEPAHWRVSAEVGGNPGRSDVVFFVGNPQADRDGDSLPALLEHAMGSSDREPNQAGLPGVQVVDGAFVFSYREDLAAEDVTIQVEVSRDLKSWTTLSVGEANRASQLTDDGRREIRWKVAPVESAPFFWRLRATAR